MSNEWSPVPLTSPEEISKGRLSRSHHQDRLEIVTQTVEALDLRRMLVSVLMPIANGWALLQPHRRFKQIQTLNRCSLPKI